jgi:hypothetical protein
LPKRIQRRRTRGWKMPADAVYVGRPTRWGNPYPIAEYGRELALANFRRRIVGLQAINALDLSELRGKDLACWCRLDQSCHADVLLEIANSASGKELSECLERS